MTMTEDRPGAFDREPSEIPPMQMSPEQLEASGLRWSTREEGNAWQQRVLNGFFDEASVNRGLVRMLPMARERLASAIAGLEDLQHELRTRTRRRSSPAGAAGAPSVHFVDGQNRDEAYWRAQATALKADIAKAVKAGPSADEAALEALCQARLTEATALNTADRVAFNEVLLRRSITSAREMVTHWQGELSEMTRRTAPYMDA